MATLAPAMFEEVLQGLDAQGVDIGVALEVPRRVEQRMRCEPELGPMFEVVRERVVAPAGHLRVGRDVPLGVEGRVRRSAGAAVTLEVGERRDASRYPARTRCAPPCGIEQRVGAVAGVGVPSVVGLGADTAPTGTGVSPEVPRLVEEHGASWAQPLEQTRQPSSERRRQRRWREEVAHGGLEVEDLGSHGADLRLHRQVVAAGEPELLLDLGASRGNVSLQAGLGSGRRRDHSFPHRALGVVHDLAKGGLGRRDACERLLPRFDGEEQRGRVDGAAVPRRPGRRLLRLADRRRQVERKRLPRARRGGFVVPERRLLHGHQLVPMPEEEVVPPRRPTRVALSVGAGDDGAERDRRAGCAQRGDELRRSWVCRRRDAQEDGGLAVGGCGPTGAEPLDRSSELGQSRGEKIVLGAEADHASRTDGAVEPLGGAYTWRGLAQASCGRSKNST